jgi:lipopolysaccharide export LptBFGC system permease protein LptF
MVMIRPAGPEDKCVARYFFKQKIPPYIFKQSKPYMNPKFTLSLVGCICFSVLVMQPYSSIAATKKVATAVEIKEEEKPAKNTRLSSSRNNNAVKIYPHLIKKAMHVVAKENDGKEIDFFVFDQEGTLLKHYKMNDGDHKKITGLERGKYIYHVFCGDEETATGKFDIR